MSNRFCTEDTTALRGNPFSLSSSMCFCISYSRGRAFTNFPITHDSVRCCHCEWLKRRERAISSISNNFRVGSSFVPIRTLSSFWSKASEAPCVFKLYVSTKERQAAPGELTRKRMSRSFSDFRADDKDCQAFKMRNDNIHPELALQSLHRAVWVSYVNVLELICPCEPRVKTIPSGVNKSFLFPPRKRLLFTIEYRNCRFKTPLANPKHCGGLTYGAKAPDGAAFFPLAVPTQDVLYGCLTSDTKARVASRHACLSSFTGQALSFYRGLSHEGTSAIDDASFSSATGLFYAATISGRHLLL